MNSRYETKKNKKYAPWLISISVIILVASVIWLYQDDPQQDNSIITKPINLPIPSSIKIDEPKTITTTIINDMSPDKIELITAISDTNEQNHPIDNISNIKLKSKEDNFRTAIESLSSNLSDWFKVKDIIKKYIVIVNDLSQNQLPFKHRSFYSLAKPIKVKKDARGLYLAKESYQRYDPLANTVAAIDPKKGLSVYLAFKPLFKQIYGEFAYPKNYRLEDIFMKAAASIINAPIIEDRIDLVKHVNRYKFADKKLESLNNVEKQMLRMGPENTRKIQAKLRQLVEVISVLNE